MDFLPEDPILEFPSETLYAVRKFYNLDKPGKMKEAVDLLEDWIKKQEHFTKKDFDRHYLETTIITCKGSVERAKSRIDKYCTARTVMRKFFGVINVKTDLRPFESVLAILPKFAPGYKRVYVMKVAYNAKLDPETLLDFVRYNIAVNDYVKRHDYYDGAIGVLDYTDFKINEFLRVANPLEMKQFSTLQMEAFGNRVVGIHILTTSKLIDTLVKLFKQVLSDKIGSRIQVHKSLNTLYDFVPKDILPEDYGGKERPLKILCDDWMEVLSSKESIDFFRSMNEACTDEKLRASDKCNTLHEYMGTPGTFKKLCID